MHGHHGSLRFAVAPPVALDLLQIALPGGVDQRLFIVPIHGPHIGIYVALPGLRAAHDNYRVAILPAVHAQEAAKMGHVNDLAPFLVHNPAVAQLAPLIMAD